jgi:hypothetical protein
MRQLSNEMPWKKGRKRFIKIRATEKKLHHHTLVVPLNCLNVIQEKKKRRSSRLVVQFKKHGFIFKSADRASFNKEQYTIVSLMQI